MNHMWQKGKGTSTTIRWNEWKGILQDICKGQDPIREEND